MSDKKNRKKVNRLSTPEAIKEMIELENKGQSMSKRYIHIQQHSGIKDTTPYRK